jgi:hypothetical protein
MAVLLDEREHTDRYRASHPSDKRATANVVGCDPAV